MIEWSQFYLQCTLKEPMEAIAERFDDVFRVSFPSMWDCENVYEWFILRTEDDLELNVSRDHAHFEVDFAGPLTISVKFGESDVRPLFPILGQLLANELRTTVQLIEKQLERGVMRTLVHQEWTPE